mmetsp:Transcript_86316/g.222299  ORF Transcript_86316/g.222299 Transcript_86316/m.222299 type:complete len:508 (-) Transcript_86316:486-2009(-)
MGACGNKGSAGTPSSPVNRVPSCKSDGIGRAQFILNNPGKINQIYSLEENKLGCGTYGSVSRGTHRSTGIVRAVKTISKGHMKNMDQFKQEIAIMKLVDHPNVIKLFETFEDRRNIYLVMELCEGGELFDHIIEAGHFTEATGAIIVQQILRAIFYMHENSISHRDLKPENFLFLTKGKVDRNVLKIIDFGLSCRFEANQSLSTRAGTPYYVAPQVLSGRYDRMCDLWSVGVIMYVLLCGYPPFSGRTDQEVLARVRQGAFSFEAKDWRHISEDAKALISGLLKMDPKERTTAEQALNHDWIKLKAPRAGNANLQESFVQNLREFRVQNKLKKAALHIIAGQLSEGQIKGLRETFIALDANGDGLLTIKELRDALGQSGLMKTNSDLQSIMDGVDSDGSGVIDYTEFLAATLDTKSYLSEDICWTAFSVFDLDGDGKITQEELKQVLDNGQVEEVVGQQSSAQILKEIDSNGDGTIDFEEFMAMMRARTDLNSGLSPARSPARAGGA